MSSDIYYETGMGVLGSNVFIYCDNNPVNKTDLQGTWAKDVHHDLTFYIAREYFIEDFAEKIATYDNELDKYYPPFPPIKAPISGSWNWIQNQKLHFNRSKEGMTDTRLVFAILMLLASVGELIEGEIAYNSGNKAMLDEFVLTAMYHSSLKYLGYW